MNSFYFLVNQTCGACQVNADISFLVPESRWLQAEFIETSMSSFSTRSSGSQADPKLFALLVRGLKGADGGEKTTRALIL